jgi:dihydropteroate synthase
MPDPRPDTCAPGAPSAGARPSAPARVLVLGIVNVTPDSFWDGGRLTSVEAAVAHGLLLADQGADWLDVGGESTRPGADPLPAEEERRRVLPVIEGLARSARVPISIDTYKASVAREAVGRGATIINDISGLQYDPRLGSVAAESGAALVLMHTRGRSREMYEKAVYADVVREVIDELRAAITRATRAGVDRGQIIVDPGFGFAKQADHSYQLLAGLKRLSELDRPILSGPSRKSFLKAALGERMPPDREWGSAAAIAASVLFGAHIVRVHGVREMVDVVRVADRIRGA